MVVRNRNGTAFYYKPDCIIKNRIGINNITFFKVGDII